jgi:thioredoxin-like negative regulator of GroEL
MKADVDRGLHAVVFIASWQAIPKRFDSNIKKLESEFPKIQLSRVDTDKSPEIVDKFKVQEIPTILFINDGVEISRAVGVILIEPLRTLFRNISEKENEMVKNKVEEVKPEVKEDETEGSELLKGDAKKIWEELKDHQLNLFALPDQIVKDHATPVPISEQDLYLTLKSPAVLIALEELAGKKYTVDKVDRFAIIRRA